MTETAPANRILTIPNLISFARVLTVPVFWWLLLGDRVAAAAWVIVALGWTDWIDGFLARRLDQVSELGKALDPVADRLIIASALVGGLVAGVVPGVIGIPLILREVMVGIMAVTLALSGGGKIEVRYLGKVATVCVYSAIPAFYLVAADVARPVMLPISWVGGVVGLALYWYVGYRYLGDTRRKMAAVESPPEPEEM